MISGYTGGPEKLPTYGTSRRAKRATRGVWVVFDPQIAYEVAHFFGRTMTPQRNGQFADLGTQYLSVIFARGKLRPRLPRRVKKR